MLSSFVQSAAPSRCTIFSSARRHQRIWQWQDWWGSSCCWHIGQVKDKRWLLHAWRQAKKIVPHWWWWWWWFIWHLVLHIEGERCSCLLTKQLGASSQLRLKLSQLLHEVKVWWYDGSFRFQKVKCLFQAKVFIVHEVSYAYCCWSTDSCLAVHQYLAMTLADLFCKVKYQVCFISLM